MCKKQLDRFIKSQFACSRCVYAALIVTAAPVCLQHQETSLPALQYFTPKCSSTSFLYHDLYAVCLFHVECSSVPSSLSVPPRCRVGYRLHLHRPNPVPNHCPGSGVSPLSCPPPSHPWRPYAYPASIGAPKANGRSTCLPGSGFR